MNLYSYITENIYGNLGISDSLEFDRCKLWCDTYNAQPEVVKFSKSSVATVSKKYPAVELHGKLIIQNPDILEDGHLPDDIKFEFGSDWSRIQIYIYTDEFNSFKNIPEVKNISVHISDAAGTCGITDWKTINNLDHIVVGAPMKSINGLTRVPYLYLYDLDATYKNLKLLSGISVNSIQLFGDMRGKETLVKDFIKNAKFFGYTQGPTLYAENLNTEDLSFLDEIKHTDIDVTVWPRKHPGISDEDYYRPLNNPKFSRITLKCPSEKKYKAGCISVSDIQEETRKINRICTGISYKLYVS